MDFEVPLLLLEIGELLPPAASIGKGGDSGNHGGTLISISALCGSGGKLLQIIYLSMIFKM